LRNGARSAVAEASRRNWGCNDMPQWISSLKCALQRAMSPLTYVDCATFTQVTHRHKRGKPYKLAYVNLS
jgi:hypothetical protein